MLLSEAFLLYASNVIAFKNQSRKTMEMNSLALKSLQKHIGDIDVSLLTFEDIRRWKEKLEDERKSANTIRGYIIKLRCVLQYLRKIKVDTLDVDEVPVPKRENTVPSWLTPEEANIFIDSVRSLRGKAIVTFLYASGIRVSELCALNRDQLHDGRFTVIGKGNKPRLCFYDQRSAIYISRYLSKRKDNSPALFVQRMKPVRMNKGGVEEIFRTARRKSKLNKTITPHTMRHSFASDLAQNGIPIHSLQRMLGHANVSTTSQYLHVSDVRLEEEYARFHSTESSASKSS